MTRRNASTIELRKCPTCRGRAVLSRNDELCSPCQVTLIGQHCTDLADLVTTMAKQNVAFLVADLTLHREVCQHCPSS